MHHKKTNIPLSSNVMFISCIIDVSYVELCISE